METDDNINIKTLLTKWKLNHFIDKFEGKLFIFEYLLILFLSVYIYYFYYRTKNYT